MTDDWGPLTDEWGIHRPDPPPGTVATNGPTVTWGWQRVVAGIFVFVLALIVIDVVIVSPFLAAFGKDAVETDYAQAIAVIVLDVSVLLLTYRLVAATGASWPNLGFRRPDAPPAAWYYWMKRNLGGWAFLGLPWTPALVLTGLVSAYFVTIFYGAIVQALGLKILEPADQIPTTLFDHTGVTIILGIGVVIFAPLAEETFFRGFLFGGLLPKLGFWGAAAVSGFLFALAHDATYASLGFLIPFGLVGVILAYVYYRGRTIFASMAMHATFNLISFIAMLALK